MTEVNEMTEMAIVSICGECGKTIGKDWWTGLWFHLHPPSTHRALPSLPGQRVSNDGKVRFA